MIIVCDLGIKLSQTHQTMDLKPEAWVCMTLTADGQQGLASQRGGRARVRGLNHSIVDPEFNWVPYEISRGSREIPPPTNASIVICLLKFAHKMGAAENNDFTVIHIPGGHSTFPTFFSRGHMKMSSLWWLWWGHMGWILMLDINSQEGMSQSGCPDANINGFREVERHQNDWICPTRACSLRPGWKTTIHKNRN